VGDAEVDKLPDPEAFRDAQFLAVHGRFSLADLDASDALTIAILWRLRR
jgi:hypothetical protein